MPGAGELRQRLAFDQKAAGDATYGATAGAWVERFQRSAKRKFLLGSEPVIGQRLSGVQPAVFTVRCDRQTVTLDSSWRLRDLRSGRSYNIRTVTPDERNTWIDILAESGGTDG